MSDRPADPIFISYSRDDADIMSRIAFFLRDHGFKIWVDNEKLVPGTPTWEQSVEEAIKNSFAVIVLVSPDSRNSSWVRREITYAEHLHKRIFPLLLKGPGIISLPLRLITRQYVDFRKDEDEALNDLLAALLFHVEEKKTLQMKRPAAGPATSAVSPTQNSLPWMLPVGILLAVLLCGLVAICIILGAFWVQGRIARSQPPGAPAPAVTVPTNPTSDAASTALLESPTESISPSPTPLVSAAAVPVPDVVQRYLADAQVTYVDTFDDPSGPGWEIPGGTIEGGTMHIIGNDNWDGAWRDRDFREGEGALIDFSFSEGSTFTVHMGYGGYGTDQYRRVGLFFQDDFPMPDIYLGPDFFLEDLSGNLEFQTDTIYEMFIAILPGQELLEVIWDPSNPTDVDEHRKIFSEVPAGSAWSFLIQANQGTQDFDNFREISFSGEE
jgi:hypothetical protein